MLLSQRIFVSLRSVGETEAPPAKIMLLNSAYFNIEVLILNCRTTLCEFMWS